MRSRPEEAQAQTGGDLWGLSLEPQEEGKEVSVGPCSPSSLSLLAARGSQRQGRPASHSGGTDVGCGPRGLSEAVQIHSMGPALGCRAGVS